ncbi:hypothetical protein DPM19_07230 [Actinomadura craniellae]|uniref:Peptidase M10 metallopeptidase domain-containing protein n=1 Tax=Actinomadura craniellae TaxID=2231787 RepID=A0A365H964_9ACTN|nr:hypothetical protein DPM19_07230 [Actinomadura craniellae]
MADPWPGGIDPNGILVHPDSGDHWYCVNTSGEYGMPAHIANNARAVTDDALGARTQAVTRYESTCDLTTGDGDGRSDTVWVEAFWEYGVLGVAYCNGMNSNGTCDRIDALLSETEINYFASNDENEYTHTACHELGHTVGLRHYDGAPPSDIGGVNDCMNSGVHDSGNILWRTYNSHHVGHINAWF